MARPEDSPTAPGALGAVLGGFIAGAIAVAISISFATLIFRDSLAPHLPIGLGLTLVGSAVLGMITAWRSAFPFAVAGVQDSTSAILAVAVSATVVAVGANALPTTVALIATATVVMGVTIFLVGQLRLGEIARFMPFPVIGGFLVATGFLLIQGAAGILGRGESGDDLLRFEALMLWVPGLVIGGAIFAAGRYVRSTLATPVALLAVTILWRVGMVVAGVGADAATTRGWLLGPFPTKVGWDLNTIGSIADADWGLVVDAWLPILSIALVSAISLILHVHALEHVSGMDVDGNRELRIGGLAGIAAGATGGLPGFIYFSDSSLLYRFGGKRRIGGVVAATVPLAVLGLGSTILGLVPVAVIGGVLISLGLSFVVEWLWDARHRLGRIDHALVLIIGVAVVVAGFLAAIALGLVIAIGLFVVRYSRVDVVRRTYTLVGGVSSVDRPQDQRQALVDHGDEVRVIEVHGFLFFGTASNLFDEQRLTDENTTLRTVVYDLHGVTGIDSSAVMALQRLDRRAVDRELVVVFAGLPERFRRSIARAITEAQTPLREFADIDSALQWCEDELLDRHLGGHEPAVTADFALLLGTMLRGTEPADAVLRNADRIDLPAGSTVIKAGEPRPGLYFLASGRLSVLLRRPDGSVVRLRQMLSGTVIGEISLYRGGGAAADVIADTDCVLWHLAIDDIERLEDTDPAAAAAVHRFAAAILAERLVHSNQRMRG